MAAFSDNHLQIVRGVQLSSRSSDYIILGLIGQGAYAKVTRCFKASTNETVAVRITKTQTEKGHGVLQKLRKYNANVCNFVKWDTSFFYKGHVCQEFELLDMNLKEFVDMRQSSSLPLKDIRPILKQLATALQVLKNLGITHTDLRQENIMLVDHVRQPLKVKLIDFGSACETSKAEQGSNIQHRWYKAPEALLGLPCNEARDMWSLGCIAAELFLGSALYPGSCDYDMIWKINQTQGQLPDYLLDAGFKTSQFYGKTEENMWQILTPQEYGGVSWLDCRFNSLDDLKKVQQKQDSQLPGTMSDKADLENFVELVKQMLQLDPTQRITPSQVLRHPFIKTSHLTDVPQSLSSTQQASTRSSCPGVRRQQNRPTEDKSPIANIQDLKNRKRAYANILQTFPYSISSQKKKNKICGDGSSLKRSHCDISKGKGRIPKTSSPVRKKRRISGDTPSSKRPYCEISKGKGRIPKTSSPVRKKRRISGDTPSSKRPYWEISKGKDIIPEMSSQMTKKRRICEDTPLLKKPVVKKSSKNKAKISSPKMKKSEICQKIPVVNVPLGALPVGSRVIPDTSSPESCKSAKVVRKHSDGISKGKKIPKISPPEKMDTKLPSTSKDAPSSMIQLKSHNKDSNKNKRPTVWIIGSSYVRRAEEAAYENFGQNFGLNAKVKWFGQGGMHWSDVLPRFYAELSNTERHPDILVIHAGGNSLGTMHAQKLASIMNGDLMQLHKAFPAMTIAYSCINEQQTWRNGHPKRIDTDRKTVNKCIRMAAGNFGGAVIEHPLLRFFDKNIYLKDGVHFNPRGNKIFVSSIRSALMKIIQT